MAAVQGAFFCSGALGLNNGSRKHTKSSTEVQINRAQIAQHHEIFLTDFSLRTSFNGMMDMLFRDPMTVQLGIWETPDHLNYISRKYFMPWLRDVNRMILLYGFCPYYYVKMKVKNTPWGIDLSEDVGELKPGEEKMDSIEKRLREPEGGVKKMYSAMENDYYYVPRVADFTQGFCTIDVNNNHQPVMRWYWSPRNPPGSKKSANAGHAVYEPNMKFIVENEPQLYTGNLSCPMVSYVSSYNRIRSILDNDQKATREASRPLLVFQFKNSSTASTSSSSTDTMPFGDVVSGRRRAEEIATENALSSGSSAQIMRDMKISQEYHEELLNNRHQELVAGINSLPRSESSRMFVVPPNWEITKAPVPTLRRDTIEQEERLDQLAGDLVGFSVRLRRSSSRRGDGASGSMEAMITMTNEQLKSRVRKNTDWFLEAWMGAFAEIIEREVTMVKKNVSELAGRALKPEEESNLYNLLQPSVRANPVPLITVETLEKMHSLSVIDDALFKRYMAQMHGIDERLTSDRPVMHPELAKAMAAPSSSGGGSSGKKSKSSAKGKEKKGNKPSSKGAPTASDKVAKKSKRKALSQGADPEKGKKRAK